MKVLSEEAIKAGIIHLSILLICDEMKVIVEYSGNLGEICNQRLSKDFTEEQMNLIRTLALEKLYEDHRRNKQWHRFFTRNLPKNEEDFS